MSGLLNTLHDLHQQHKERREERREERHGGHHHDQDDRSTSHQYAQRPYRGDDGNNDAPRRPPQGYASPGYVPPAGPPPPSTYGSSGQGGYPRDDRAQSYHPGQGQTQTPGQGGQGAQGYGYSGGGGGTGGGTGFASQGGLDRGDFASDADIDRMVATGEFGSGRGGGGRGGGGGEGDGEYGANLERHNAYGRHDTTNVPHPAQRYGERANEYGRYDAPSGPPPPGQGYRQDAYQPSYESGGYGGGPDRPGQYGPPQGQGYNQYDAPQRPPQGYGQSNAPVNEYGASRPAEDRYGSGYGGPTNERPYRGAGAGDYNQQGVPGGDDRYSHLANMAEAHGDDPQLYRRATQGLHDRIQTQAESRPSQRSDEGDYQAHVDAHKKAYGGDDHGPMSNDAIGAAAAMEAIKQAAASAKSSNAPAGAMKPTGPGKPSGGTSSRPAQSAGDEEEAAARANAGAGGGGLQDKLMALAMSQAGKLFDKKNAGSGGDKAQDKAQAMQSAAATAMQLFQKYQTKGALDASDMSSVMGLASKLF